MTSIIVVTVVTRIITGYRSQPEHFSWYSTSLVGLHASMLDLI